MEERFDTSGYSNGDNRALPIGKNQKKIGLIKNELGGKVMTKFVALRAKMCVYRKIDKKSGGKALQRYKKVCGF